jgi:hypothetical protein
MKRRQAVKLILLLGGGTVAGFGGYKAYHIFKTPDIAYLDNSQALLDALVDVIIPATTTPGAKAAGVGSYVLSAVKNNCDKKTQNNFIDGLKDLQSHCQSKYSKPFEQCDAAQQNDALLNTQKSDKLLGGKLGKAQKKLAGNTFFNILKEFTVYGYCTSKVGAQQGLAYDYIPGSFKGCIPLQSGQRSWATK